MNTEHLWKHTWPSSTVLCEFIASNRRLFEGRTIVELGAGSTALPSLTALRCGASKCWITEDGRLDEQVFKYIRGNVKRNLTEDIANQRVKITSLDWSSEESIKEFVGGVDRLDYILGSDVFFDPSVFSSLISTAKALLDAHPRAEFIFAYQIRDSDWTIEDLLQLNRLECRPIRLVETGDHSIYIGKIFKTMELSGNLQSSTRQVSVFAGIEGGATHSTLVLIDSTGHVLGEWSGPGLNPLLIGVEATSETIGEWFRRAFQEVSQKANLNVHLPISALGMGLSGAEDPSMNEKLLFCLKLQHADLAKEFFLTADSVISISAAFDKGGVVMISGTGSTCRLLKADGSIHGVGGWGHLIGDGAGGFWITMLAVRGIFDADDGYANVEEDTSRVKARLLSHFGIKDKLELLDLLYGKDFNKSVIASFCIQLAEVANRGDPFARRMFREAGESLAQHIFAISKHFDEDMLSDVPILAIGSVFKSWRLMREGFIGHLSRMNNASGKRLSRVSIFELTRSAAVGAAVLAAKTKGLLPADEEEKLILKTTGENRREFDQILL